MIKDLLLSVFIEDSNVLVVIQEDVMALYADEPRFTEAIITVIRESMEMFKKPMDDWDPNVTWRVILKPKDDGD